MPDPKYGLVEDIDKFIETQGEEGVAGVNPPANPPVDPPATPPADPPVNPPVDPPATPPADPPVNPPATDFNIQEHQEYIDLKTKYDELAGNQPAELSPQIKEIDDWARRTGRPVEDWVKFQRDPGQMSDMDIVREHQQMLNPSLTPEQLDFYIKDQFLADEMADDDDKMRKDIALKRAVDAGKHALEENRLVFNSKAEGSITEEQQQDLEFARTVREERSIAEAANNKMLENVRQIIKETDVIPLNLGGGKSINFGVPAESKADHDQFVGNMPRWVNQDGSTNERNLTEDMYKLRHFDDILKTVYEQGMNDQIEQSARRNANLQDPERILRKPADQQFGYVGRSSQRRKQV